MQHHTTDNTLTFIHCLLYILYYLYIQFWQSRQSRIQMQPPEVVLKFCRFPMKTPVLQSLIYKIASITVCNVIKKRHLCRCFPAKSEQFLRTPILKNIWTTASLYLLLHHILIFTIHYGTCTNSFSSGLLIKHCKWQAIAMVTLYVYENKPLQNAFKCL